MAESTVKRKYAERWCPHCNSYVAKTTFYNHRDIYFVAGVWHKNSMAFELHTPSVSGLKYEGNVEANVSSLVERVQTRIETDTTNSSDLSDEDYLSNDEEAATEDEFVDDIDTVDTTELIPAGTSDQTCTNSPIEVTTDTDLKPGQQLLKEFFLKLMYIQHLTNMSTKVFTIIMKLVLGLLSVIAETFCVKELTELVKECVSSMHGLKKTLGISKDEFKIFVVCPSCNTLYTEKQAVKRMASGVLQSKRCSNKPYPMHTQRTKRSACGTVLMKRIKTKLNKDYLTPKKSYPYASVINSLKDFLSRPGFIEKCNEWKKREIVEGRIEDVYDGEIWKEFQRKDGKSFLENGRTFGFMLNVDWFQPYKHVGHSVGVIYLSFMNLPREERFKEENMMVVGVIPGPNEPAGNINAFLQPLVDELNILEKGIRICGNLFQAALLCVAADLPAIRKTCGFLSCSAKQGCSKCYKTYKCGGFGEKTDYSGYESNILRSGAIHKRRSDVTMRQVTPLARKQKEVILSARYSVLNQLDYFDPVRFHIIDPMHNLLLGTAKHMVRVWKENELLSNDSFEEIQELVNDFVVPCDIGRIPNHISAMFSSLTADQWKHWTCIYSLFVLKDKLDVQHYNCWSIFVSVCRLLCRRTISKQDLNDADRCLHVFLNTFEKLYDKSKYCTPNMHMHLHLRKCIEDYGSVYSFWCFSFERLNGILGEFNLNNHKVNVTLMRHFQQKFRLRNLVNVCENLVDVDLLSNKEARGTVASSEKSITKMTQPLKLKYFAPEVKTECQNLIKSSKGEVVRVKHHYHSAKSMVLRHRFITTSETSIKNSVVFIQSNGNEMRAGVIRDIMKIFYLVKENGKLVERDISVVQMDLYSIHPNRYFFGKNSPVQVFGVDFEYENEIVEIEKISCRAGWLQHPVKISNNYCERVTVVIPLLD